MVIITLSTLEHSKNIHLVQSGSGLASWDGEGRQQKAWKFAKGHDLLNKCVVEQFDGINLV